MAEMEKQADIIDLSGCVQYGPEDLKNSLREVRALIVYLLGSASDVNPAGLPESHS